MQASILIFISAIAFATLVYNTVSDKSSLETETVAPEIQLSNGILAGTIKQSRNGRAYWAFLGVRYANPPRRFERAVIFNQTWEDVQPAVKYGARCPQTSWSNDVETFGDEDCLFSNVYVPAISLSNKTLSVLVWIHGGAFRVGEGNSYSPEYFMDQDIIIVTINYRLGALGFLSTEDDVVPANNGLRDQVVALQWIQKNIQAFGGDPKKITIMGESAGGASVHYLMLSPLAKGLFQNAICVSGSALDPWARTRDPLKTASKLGESVNCSTSSSLALVQCLKRQSVTDILLHTQKLTKWNIDPITIFGPTVERTNREDAFLPDAPESLLEAGKYNKVPLIIGVNEKEGLAMQAAPILANKKLIKELNEEWETYAPITFLYDDRFNKDDLPAISDKIRKFYFGDNPVGLRTRENLTNLYSDVYFVYGTRKTALSMAKHNTVYLYMYSYKAEFFFASRFGVKENIGPTHVDDLHLYWITKSFGPPIGIGSPSYEFSENLVKLWVSFAEDGVKPTKTWNDIQEWEPVDSNTTENGKLLKWLNIRKTLQMLEEPFYLRRKQFWDDLFREYMGEKSHRDEF